MVFQVTRPITRQALPLFRTIPRSFSTTTKFMGSQPQANMPDSGPNQKQRQDKGLDTPNTDSQSNASKEEHKSGEDHPAKQPDPQAQPTRSTGIGGNTPVKGKEARSEAGEKNLKT
jgi:hypothetical protein